MWLRYICDNRERFRNTILIELDVAGDIVRALGFLFAFQLPRSCWFLNLRSCTSPPIDVQSLELPLVEFEAGLPLAFVYNYEYNNCDVLRDTSIGNWVSSSYLVLDECCWLPGRIVASDLDPIPFNNFVAFLEVKKRTTVDAGPRVPRRPAVGAPELPEWLAELLPGPGAGASSASSSRGGSSAAATVRVDPPALSDDIVAETWDEVRLKREELKAKLPVDCMDWFTVRLLGGGWTKKHKRKPFDAYQGFARGGKPFTWAETLYGVGATSRYSIGDSGEEGAYQLAVGWCRQHNYYFKLWIELGEINYVYCEDDYLSYDDGEFIGWILEQGADSPIWDRGQELRNNRPLRRIE